MEEFEKRLKSTKDLSENMVVSLAGTIYYNTLESHSEMRQIVIKKIEKSLHEILTSLELRQALFENHELLNDLLIDLSKQVDNPSTSKARKPYSLRSTNKRNKWTHYGLQTP